MSHRSFRFLFTFIIFLTLFIAAPGYAGVFDVNLDPSFGNNGIVETNTGGAANASDLLIQSDGKIVVTGLFDEDPDNPGGRQFILVRYNSDGSLDDTFGVDGIFISNIAREALSVAVVRRPDGKYILGGQVDIADDGSFFGFLFLQVLADGSGVDNTFGSPIVFGPSALKSSGFGTPGGTILNFMDEVVAFDMVLQSDGKAVLVGAINNDGDDFFDAFALARVTEDGVADGGFGTDGKVIDPPLSEFVQEGRAVVLQNGKIIVGGLLRADVNGNIDFAVARFNSSDGSLDTSFGTDGYAIVDSGGEDVGNDLALQPDNKIILAGSSISSPGEAALLRLNPDGDPDASFGNNGLSIVDLGGDTETFASGVALQGDGKIMIAGGTGSPEGTLVPQDFLLARFNSDGSLDTGFGNNGSIATNLDNFSGASSLAIQSDGKPVATGFSAPEEALTLGDLFATLRYLVTPAGDDDDDDDAGGGCSIGKGTAHSNTLIWPVWMLGVLALAILRRFFLRVK